LATVLVSAYYTYLCIFIFMDEVVYIWDQWAESSKMLCLQEIRQVAVLYRLEVRQLVFG